MYKAYEYGVVPVNNNACQVIEHDEQQVSMLGRAKNFFGRAKNALAVGFAGASGLAMTSTASAAELDFSGATEELGGVKTTIVAIIGTLVVLVGIGLAWKYFKRTAH